MFFSSHAYSRLLIKYNEGREGKKIIFKMDHGI